MIMIFLLQQTIDVHKLICDLSLIYDDEAERMCESRLKCYIQVFYIQHFASLKIPRNVFLSVLFPYSKETIHMFGECKQAAISCQRK